MSDAAPTLASPVVVASLVRVLTAAAFAAHKHRDQRRKDAGATPYINHPLALAHLLASEGAIADEVILCAALLHDTLEDTETTLEELTALFGSQVAGVVLEVSDDKALPQATRKALEIEHAEHLSHAAKLVKLADKVCNLRDLLDSAPANWSRERKLAYFEGAARVVSAVRGVSPRLEALFDAVYARRTELG